jgi:hypothetical protein
LGISDAKAKQVLWDQAEQQMNPASGANRWWENYLVRYLMPSIAGVVIVNALSTQAGPDFRMLLFLPPPDRPLDAASLTLLFLYGNLFCYIASLPILVFHGTRVLDFSDGKWPASRLLDGYIMTSALAVLTFALTFFAPEQWRFWGAFILAVSFVVIQFCRLYAGLSRRVAVFGLSHPVSPMFGFAYTLARRRGVPEETEMTKIGTPSPAAAASVNAPSDIDDDDEEEEIKEVTTSRRIKWRPEFIDTYRHLREHGNSAFIFVLELVLAALAYCVGIEPARSDAETLSSIGQLFALWAFPSFFVHLASQHLERRFSRYDFKLKELSEEEAERL